jgi:DNA-binding transcriptional MerR regulator
MATDVLLGRILDADPGSPDAGVQALLALHSDLVLDPRREPLSIADASRLLGLSAHTLRYYEDQGLVHPARNDSGYREYSAEDLRRLVFVTRMRVSGMSMRDLTRYVALVEQGDQTIPERRRMMFEQRDRVLRQLRELTLALETTEYKIREYDAHPEG